MNVLLNGNEEALTQSLMVNRGSIDRAGKTWVT